MPSCKGSSQPKDRILVSCLQHWQTSSLPLTPPGQPVKHQGGSENNVFHNAVLSVVATGSNTTWLHSGFGRHPGLAEGSEASFGVNPGQPEPGSAVLLGSLAQWLIPKECWDSSDFIVTARGLCLKFYIAMRGEKKNWPLESLPL